MALFGPVGPDPAREQTVLCSKAQRRGPPARRNCGKPCQDSLLASPTQPDLEGILRGIRLSRTILSWAFHNSPGMGYPALVFGALRGRSWARPRPPSQSGAIRAIGYVSEGIIGF